MGIQQRRSCPEGLKPKHRTEGPRGVARPRPQRASQPQPLPFPPPRAALCWRKEMSYVKVLLTEKEDKNK